MNKNSGKSMDMRGLEKTEAATKIPYKLRNILEPNKSF